MKIAPRFPSAAVAAAFVFLAVAAMVTPRLAAAQGAFLDGYWDKTSDQNDAYDPDEGDYVGLPLNKAAVSRSRTWDSEEYETPINQCRPHPPFYGLLVGESQIWQSLDPFTYKQTSIETWVGLREERRHIWMDNRAPPPPWAPLTWMGYSTGKWVGNVLYTHTTRLKPSFPRRNGIPTSDRAFMDEVFFRYGDLLTQIVIGSDPVYMTEPWVKSIIFKRDQNAVLSPSPCDVDEAVPQPMGMVPMHLPNEQDITLEWAAKYHIPLQASEGGAETMLPEYQDTLERLPPPPEFDVLHQRAQAEEDAGEAAGE